MYKNFKLLSLILSIVMIFTLMASCSDKSDKKTSENSKEQDRTDSESKSEGSNAEKLQDQSKEDAEKADAPSGENFKVILITMDQMDQHWVNLNNGAEKAVEELASVDFQWMAPDTKDDNKQIEMVNNALASQAQAIIIAANGPDAITSVLREVDDAGVKIVYVDSPANFEGYKTFATNNKEAGKTAGLEMKKALEAKGIKDGKVGVISVNSATQSTVDREEGLRLAFEGSNFEVLETQYTEGDVSRSKDAAANFITQGCVAIFATNEGTTVGTGNAIKEAGGEVIGVGFDKSDKILELIEEGYLLAAMAQNPYVMGYEGVKAAVSAIKGEDPGEKLVDTGVSVISKENIAEFK